MLFKDAIYSNVVTTLDLLQNKINLQLDEIEQLESKRALSPEEKTQQTKLTDFFVCIDGCKETVANAKEHLIGVPCLPSVKEKLREAVVTPDDVFERLLTIIDLSSEVEKDPDCLEEQFDIITSKFTISAYEGYDLPFLGFAYFNEIDKQESLGYLDFENFDSSDIHSYGFTRDLIALLQIKYFEKIDTIPSRKIILHRSDVAEITHIVSALKALAIFQGLVIHTPKLSNISTNSEKYCVDVSCKKPYSQFLETLIILSEANDRADVLGKYLHIYHVIESFMHKVPLVHLSDTSSGNVFKIRGFKNLFKEIERSERDSLNRLFNKPRFGAIRYWDLELGSAFNNNTFEEVITDNLNRLQTLPAYDESKYNDFFYSLGFTNNDGEPDTAGFTKFKNSPTAKRYVDILYLIRCSIVHNKETEFHISHFTLTEDIVGFIDHILVQPLTVLICRLICDERTNVWYKDQNLKLYQ
ncbi:hypothetical protein KW439_10020 [Vibrio fluvialis]|nr:hypothetical protein [Vibrio fluvialis]